MARSSTSRVLSKFGCAVTLTLVVLVIEAHLLTTAYPVLISGVSLRLLTLGI